MVTQSTPEESFAAFRRMYFTIRPDWVGNRAGDNVIILQLK